MVPLALPLSWQVDRQVRKTQLGVSIGNAATELLMLRDEGDIVRHDVITRITLLSTHSMFAHEKGEQLHVTTLQRTFPSRIALPMKTDLLSSTKKEGYT